MNWSASMRGADGSRGSPVCGRSWGDLFSQRRAPEEIGVPKNSKGYRLNEPGDSFSLKSAKGCLLKILI